MIKQNFIIVCESAVIEKGTNNLYLLGIFENIFTAGVPVIQSNFAVVTNFEGGVGEHSHSIVIRHESGDQVGKLDGKINFAVNSRAQYIGKFLGFPFPKFGKYTIEVYLDNTPPQLATSLNILPIPQA